VQFKRVLYYEDNRVGDEMFYRLLLFDERGKLVKDTGLTPSHSYVLQFLQGIEALLGAITKTAKDINNTSQTIVRSDGQMNFALGCDAPAGDDTYGIVVGTNDGAIPESNTNYKLDTKILHSAVGEAGKLNYRAVTLVAPTPIAGNVDLDVSRPFINETADPIVVKEIGIYVKSYDGSAWHYFLILRDVVSDFSVSAGYTLTVVYTLRTTI